MWHIVGIYVPTIGICRGAVHRGAGGASGAKHMDLPCESEISVELPHLKNVPSLQIRKICQCATSVIYRYSI